MHLGAKATALPTTRAVVPKELAHPSAVVPKKRESLVFDQQKCGRIVFVGDL